jgi:hypothetical protein
VLCSLRFRLFRHHIKKLSTYSWSTQNSEQDGVLTCHCWWRFEAPVKVTVAGAVVAERRRRRTRWAPFQVSLNPGRTIPLFYPVRWSLVYNVTVRSHLNEIWRWCFCLIRCTSLARRTGKFFGWLLFFVWLTYADWAFQPRFAIHTPPFLLPFFICTPLFLFLSNFQLISKST